MKIDPTKRTKKSFEFLLENADGEIDVQFIIKMKEMNLSFPCRINEGILDLEIPVLQDFKNIFTDKIYESYIQVIIDGNYFKPWEGQLELIKPTKIEIKESKESKKDKKIKIKEKDTKESKDIKEPTKSKEIGKSKEIEESKEIGDAFKKFIKIQ